MHMLSECAMDMMMLSVLHSCLNSLAPTPDDQPCMYNCRESANVWKSSLFSTPSTCTCPALGRSSASARLGRRAFLHPDLHVLNRRGVLGKSVMVISTMLEAEHIGMHTFVPDQPSLKATSFATSSPNPSIRPLTKGRRRFMAAPLTRPQSVGGLYSMSGDEDDEGGDGEESSLFAS
jgi:hypothetical protein